MLHLEADISSLTVSGNARTINSVSTLPSVFAGTMETTSFIKTGGTSAQFLKADGSVDSTTYTGDQDLSGYLLNTTDTLTGRLTITSSVRVGNDTATATSANEGATRYYADANGSYMDMVMQYQNSGVPANDYKWTNVVRHIFPS